MILPCGFRLAMRVVAVVAMSSGIVCSCTPDGQPSPATPKAGTETRSAAPLCEEEAWRKGYESVVEMLRHTGSTGAAEWQSAGRFTYWRKAGSQSGSGVAGAITYFGYPPEGGVGMLDVSPTGQVLRFVNRIAVEAEHPEHDEQGNVTDSKLVRSTPRWAAARAVRIAREALHQVGIDIPDSFQLVSCRYFDRYVGWTISWEEAYAGGRLLPLHGSPRAGLSSYIRVSLCEEHGILDIRTSEGAAGEISDTAALVSSEDAAVHAAAVVPVLLRDEINPWTGTNYEFRGVERLQLVARVPTWDLDPIRSGRLERGEEEYEPPRLAWAVQMIVGVPEDASPMARAARPEINVFVDAMTGGIIGLDYRFGTGR